jgi:hypothetical protein
MDTSGNPVLELLKIWTLQEGLQGVKKQATRINEASGKRPGDSATQQRSPPELAPETGRRRPTEETGSRLVRGERNTTTGSCLVRGESDITPEQAEEIRKWKEPNEEDAEIITVEEYGEGFRENVMCRIGAADPVQISARKYANPDVLTRLVGEANEDIVFLNGDDTPLRALVDSGAVTSTISRSLARKLNLQPLEEEAKLMITSYNGKKEMLTEIVVVELNIPNQNYKAMEYFFVTQDNPYSAQVAVILGTPLIDWVIKNSTEAENQAWQRTRLGRQVKSDDNLHLAPARRSEVGEGERKDSVPGQQAHHGDIDAGRRKTRNQDATLVWTLGPRFKKHEAASKKPDECSADNKEGRGVGLDDSSQQGPTTAGAN